MSVIGEGLFLEVGLQRFDQHVFCHRPEVSPNGFNLFAEVFEWHFQSLSRGVEQLTVSDSDIDAIWFRRDRPDGDVSWEIRHLSTSPFALCESFPADAAPAHIDETKRAMEERIRERASTRAPLLD